MNNELSLDSLLTYFNLSNNAIGSSRWWNKLAKNEAPFIYAQQGGSCWVLFIWQDPKRDKHSSTTGSVLLNINGLTNHNTWQPRCLKRYKDSDVWFACLNIDKNGAAVILLYLFNILNYHNLLNNELTAVRKHNVAGG